MNPNYLDFEQPIADLEAKIQELRQASSGPAVDVDAEVQALQDKLRKRTAHIFRDLAPWQVSQLARHPARPYTYDYLQVICEEFQELAGDRAFADDEAIVGGFARFKGEPVAVIGQEKGNDTKSRLRHNFGMARPEGYRKAIRLMDLADRFDLPVVTLVDTAGAYPGIDAEERGQAEAIARSTEKCLSIRVPMVSVVIGEGGSGGAIALATANRVYMLEHSIYSVISPEGAASILWRDSTRARDAATNMKITAQDLLGLKVIDGIIVEPVGGAHREPNAAIEATGRQIAAAFDELKAVNEDYREHRRQKYLSIGR